MRTFFKAFKVLANMLFDYGMPYRFVLTVILGIAIFMTLNAMSGHCQDNLGLQREAVESVDSCTVSLIINCAQPNGIIIPATGILASTPALEICWYVNDVSTRSRSQRTMKGVIRNSKLFLEDYYTPTVSGNVIVEASANLNGNYYYDRGHVFVTDLKTRIDTMNLIMTESGQGSRSASAFVVANASLEFDDADWVVGDDKRHVMAGQMSHQILRNPNAYEIVDGGTTEMYILILYGVLNTADNTYTEKKTYPFPTWHDANNHVWLYGAPTGWAGNFITSPTS